MPDNLDHPLPFQPIHVIPVGGTEPLHVASVSCWCHPLPDEGAILHNASDCREARERQGSHRPGLDWVLVYGTPVAPVAPPVASVANSTSPVVVVAHGAPPPSWWRGHRWLGFSPS